MRKALRDSLGNLLSTIDKDTTRDEIDLKVKEKPMQDAYIRLYADVGTFFAEYEAARWKRSHNILIQKTEWKDIWYEQLKAYAINRAGRRITGVTEYTRKLIWQELTKIKEGEGVSLTATNIQKAMSTKMKQVERWRAIRIAQTEIVTAQNQGSFVAANSTGLPMQKEWSAAGANVRETHQMTNGQIKDIKEPFIVGGVWPAETPGDPNLPPEEVINCKCMVFYDPV
jgi:hypothetical protein